MEGVMQEPQSQIDSLSFGNADSSDKFWAVLVVVGIAATLPFVVRNFPRLHWPFRHRRLP